MTPPEVPQQHPEEVFKQSTTINEEQAREALMEYVSEHCCYGKGTVNDMVIRDIKPSSAYHYELVSFTESRKTKWKTEPYKSGNIDGPENGPAPPPWSIVVNHKGMFNEGKEKVEVPHTATVKSCHRCCGYGYTNCHHCNSTGRDRCTSCSGSGRKQEMVDGDMQTVNCNWCNGAGYKSCMHCHGSGRVTCETCHGSGRLKCFIRLTVKWKNHKDNHVVERSDLPDELIVDAEGTEIFSQQLPRVWPITTFHDQEINNASQNLIQKHSAEYKNELMHIQKHLLRAVPVSEVSYEWDEKNLKYWVYGHDHKVHAPDYPQTCCWGCTIL